MFFYVNKKMISNSMEQHNTFKHSLTGNSHSIQQRISIFTAGKQDTIYFNDEVDNTSTNDVVVNLYLNKSWQATVQIFGGRKGTSFGYKAEGSDTVYTNVFTGEAILGGIDIHLN